MTRKRVSDHAVLRYMDRVLGIDVEQLRDIMADATARHQGAPCVRSLGARFLLQDGRVITAISEADGAPNHDELVRLMRGREQS
ncbi:MAG: hypothetical protein KF810_02785 [Rhizobiaceae bacterium]|nr:hypothetical protein [Rhizobiaceae bacterium]